MKSNTLNVEACAVIYFQKWIFLEFNVTTKHQKLKVHFKSSSFEIHSSNCGFKTGFFQTSIFKSYLLILISALLFLTGFISKFQKLVEKDQTHMKEFLFISENEFGVLILNVFGENILSGKMNKKTISLIGKMLKANVNAESFPTYQILTFEVSYVGSISRAKSFLQKNSKSTRQT